MPFAPLAFLRQNPPARKQTSHNNPVTAPDHADGNGTESFTLKFHSPPIPKGHPTSTQTLPPTHNSKPSLYTPPPHYHLLQAEHFLVLSGTGLWHLSRNRTLRLSSGDTISPPSHTTGSKTPPTASNRSNSDTGTRPSIQRRSSGFSGIRLGILPIVSGRGWECRLCSCVFFR